MEDSMDRLLDMVSPKGDTLMAEICELHSSECDDPDTLICTRMGYVCYDEGCKPGEHTHDHSDMRVYSVSYMGRVGYVVLVCGDLDTLVTQSGCSTAAFQLCITERIPEGRSNRSGQEECDE